MARVHNHRVGTRSGTLGEYGVAVLHSIASTLGPTSGSFYGFGLLITVEGEKVKNKKLCPVATLGEHLLHTPAARNQSWVLIR